jgi:hypothetical protein
MSNQPHKSGNSGDSGATSDVIVQGAEVATGALAAAVNRNPNIEIVTKVAKDVVVLRATGSDLNTLKTQFPGLLIEPNEELRY